jgi:hypothetical protein
MSLDAGGLRFSTPQVGLRDSFKQIVKEEFRDIIGPENSPGRSHMEKAFESLFDGSTKELDFGSLPEKTQRDLKKLGESAEGFEAIFVKGLLTQMRKSSFAEKEGPYGDLAKDFMDQAIAEQTASTGGGMGLASTIFRSMAPRLLREAPGLAAKAAEAPKTTVPPAEATKVVKPE